MPRVSIDELCTHIAKIDRGVDWSLIYPPFAQKYRATLAACQEEDADYYADHGFRTYGEQTTLYLQGRRTKGPHAGEPNYPHLGLHVTQAKAGESDHNFGIAIDSTRDSDLHRRGLQPDWNIEHYEPLARNAAKHGLVALYYSASFREGPHVALDVESKGLTRQLVRIEFERQGLHDFRAGLRDVFAYLDRFGPW